MAMDIVRNAAFLVEVCFHSEQMLTVAPHAKKGEIGARHSEGAPE